MVSANARSSSNWASSALAWIQPPWPNSTRPASASRTAATDRHLGATYDIWRDTFLERTCLKRACARGPGAKTARAGGLCSRHPASAGEVLTPVEAQQDQAE